MKMAEKACLEKQKNLESSEAKLQLLLETTPARIVNLDLNGNILYINHTTTRRTVKEVREKNVYDLLSPEEQKKLKQILRTVIKTGRKYRYEPYIIHPDGKTNWYENTVAPVKRNGKVVEFIITAADTTERKKAEIELQKALDELKRSEQKRLLFLKAAPERIVSADLNGKILYVNRADTMRTQDIIGADITQFVASEERNRLSTDHEIRGSNRNKRDPTRFNLLAATEKSSFSTAPLLPSKKTGKSLKFSSSPRISPSDRKAEAALKESEEKLTNTMAEQSPNMIFIYRLKDSIAYVNKRYARVNGALETGLLLASF